METEGAVLMAKKGERKTLAVRIDAHLVPRHRMSLAIVAFHCLTM